MAACRPSWVWMTGTVWPDRASGRSSRPIFGLPPLAVPVWPNSLIAPGRRTQALQIGSNLSQAEHFYIHVVGTPKDADPPPNFAIGDAVAPYDSRPRRFTPSGAAV